jgi:hypothetical protein
MLRTLSTLLLLTPMVVFAADKPSVSDLAWMTGSWDGSGDTVLEENWGLPRAGTIVSLVRQTSADGTMMVEVVSIEEANDTLDLYLQQWDVPFTPRSDQAQKMTLREMTDNSVTFDAVTEGGLKVLKYIRLDNDKADPADDEFHVDVTIATGQNFVIKLTPQPR